MNLGVIKKIISNEHYSDIIKGAGAAFLIKVLASFVSFLLTLKIARALGAEESGYYFFVISTLLFLSSLSSFGLFNAVLKEASLNLNKKRYLSSLLNTSILVVAFGCTLIYLIWFVYDEFKVVHGLEHYIIDQYSLVILLAVFPFTLTFIFSSYFQARRAIFLSMLMLNLSYQTLMLLMVHFFSLSTLPEIFNILIWSLAATVLIAILICIISYRHSFKLGSGVTVSGLLSLSLPMMVAHVVSQINLFSGQFFLSIYTSASDISLFSVSLRIATLMTFLVFAINRISAPKFAVLYKEGKLEELRKVVIFSNRILFVCAIPVLLFVIYFGRTILSYFGDEFIDAYYILIILIFGQFISSVTGTVIFLLQMTGLHKELRNNVIFSAMFSIILGAILIPKYGLIGAAIMTFFSLSLTNLFSCYKAYKVLGINPLKIF